MNESKAAGQFVFLFADNRAYMLALQSPRAELGPGADAILDRFTFLKPAQPMLQPHEEKPKPAVDRVVDQKCGVDGSSAAGIGGGAVLLILVLFGAWMMIRARG